MRQGSSLKHIMPELQRQQQCKRDWIVPSRSLQFLCGKDDMQVAFKDAGADTAFGITPLARRQLAERLRIPYQYFDRMRELAPELLEKNVNSWLQYPYTDPSMVRTLDGDVRAFLSPKYRRLDNFELGATVLPLIHEMPNAHIASIALTETHFYLKVLFRGVETDVRKGDAIRAGVYVSNSEVGAGALKVVPLVMRLVCENGMILNDDGFSRNHVGKVQRETGVGSCLFSDDTMEAEDKAFFLKLRDIIADAASIAKLELTADKLRRLYGLRIKNDVQAAVQQLSNDLSLTVEERAGVFMSFVEQHECSAFGLLNAVTDFSKNAVDYDRATEIEAMGGEMLSWSPERWHRILDASAVKA